ncbi:MAG: serine/threonine-protein kinase [Chloroflexota bacterium]
MSISLPRIYANRYEIERLIGEGAFSRTYLATDTVLHRPVALKVLRQEYCTVEEFAARFDREAHAAAKVSHPNVVPVYDFGREQDVPFIVMQYVSGPSLKEYVRDNGPLTIEESIEFARQILDGLTAIHDNDIIHRDVKPQNILLEEDKRAKLTDFGVAFVAQEAGLTDAGSTVGTAAYMAPEQASGEGIGPASDLYAVGVILYEMLTGQLPFRGDNPVQVMYRHVSELPPAPRTLNSYISLPLEQVVLKALAKQPQDRYPDARAMRDALVGSAAGASAVTSNVEVTQKSERFRLPPEQHTPAQAAPPLGPPTDPPAPPRRQPSGRPWPVPFLLMFAVILMAVSGYVLADQFNLIDGGNRGGADAGNGDEEGIILDDSETETEPPAGATATTEPEPTEEPEPTPTDEPTPEPTPEPEEPAPTATEPETPDDDEGEDNPGQGENNDSEDEPGGNFNTPMPGQSLPSPWTRGPSETFGRDQFVEGGAYRRDDGELYGRPAAHLYSQETDYPATTVTFNVNDGPSSYIGIRIIGMDDESEGRVPMRLSLNDNVVWEGESPFEDEEWTEVIWRVGSLGWIEEGENTMTIEVLAPDGEFGLPPWLLLNEAQVYWG